MTTASVQDIDSFIRLQKEKLNRDKFTNNNVDFGYNQPIYNPTLDFNRQQLDNYLNISRNPIDQFRGQDEFIHAAQTPPPPPPQQVRQPPQRPQQQLQQQPPQQNQVKNRNANANRNNQDGNFFDKFGSKYDAQKNKLKNELQNEYAEYMQQKNQKEARGKFRNQAPVSDEFYATLPLEGLGGSKENIVRQRNTEYNVLKEKLENSSKRKSIEWWKDKNDPEIKPYSKHAGSSENISNIDNSPYAFDQKNKSLSQYDVISDRRLQQPVNVPAPQNDRFNYDSNFQRPRSANSFENLNRYPPVDPYYPQSLAPAIDPSLTDILRRPPVGLRSAVGIPQTSRVQFNDNVQFNQIPSNQYNYQEPPRNQSYALDSYRNSQPQVTRPKDNNPFNFSEEQNNKDLKSVKAREYQEELERQVREKQLKKQKEKEEQDKLDKKMLIESAIYNPYGRSGGGAPIKDKDGNTVANLSQVKADPLQYSPRDLPPPSSLINNILSNSKSNSNDLLNMMQPNSGRKTGPNDEQSFARGGNGIFGEGKSDDQKKKGEKYKAELQQQIEEKQRQKALEKEKIRIEEEKEQKRIEEEQRKMKLELEEEERKKKLKEENEKNLAENAKRLADENRKKANNRVPNKPVNKRLPRKPSVQDDGPINSPPIVQTEFRTNSPPVPAAAKKLNGGKAPAKNNNNNLNKNTPNTNSANNFKNDDQDDQNNDPPARNFSPPPPKPVANNKNKVKSNATADYYITESRLNVSSPANNKKVNSNLPTVNDNEEGRVPSSLINDYENENFKNTKNSKINNKKNNKMDARDKFSDNSIIPTKPVLRKTNISRPGSQVSNSEVLAQLNSLKKHLQNEQSEIENRVNNSNGKANISQIMDIRDNLLNVRTPSGDGRDGFKTYRKYIDTPPIQGGLEPKTYFRDNTILLDSSRNNNDIFSSDLQREARDRQLNRLNSLIYQDDAFTGQFNDQLSVQNQMRLKKLRDMEDDSLSLNDPNDVLNKFISRNNRQPSAVTIQDDAWLRQPA